MRQPGFRGAKSMTDNDASPISTSKTWPSPVTSDASTGTIAYAIENPMTFITGNNSNFDWMYTGDSTVDDTRWASQKTMYDPCPVGWRVPDGGENGAWVGITKDSWDYSYHTVKTWVNNDTYANYPAAPYLNEGNMVDPEEAEGWYGHYWSCTSKGNGRFYEFTLWYPGYLNQTTSYKVPEYGYSVRCQKEN